MTKSHTFKLFHFVAGGLVPVWLIACSGSGSSVSGPGGGAAGGGSSTSAGGASSAFGGSSANGGAALGGAATGGAATGGAATGGKAADATAGAATGGKAAGGAATGGAATGGKPAGGAANGGVVTGGTAEGGKATGGAATGGKAAGGTATGGVAAGGKATGGAATGGAVTTGGSGGTPSTGSSAAPSPSPGCAATPTTTACNTQASPCHITAASQDRTYYVQLPDKYDPTHPYPVVFEYHPLGGNGWMGLTMYQIRPKMPNAIYVSPDGLASGGNQGFANTNGGDEAMTRAIMSELEGKYCVDMGRYFATGFSYGGSMSYTAACNMSDVFRAIGAMAGAPISGATCTSKKLTRPVAVWATHGDNDTALPITMAQPIIDALAKNNGCTTATQPTDPSPCVAYQGCTTGAPVVWCVRPGDGHAIPSFAAGAIATFLQQF